MECNYCKRDLSPTAHTCPHCGNTDLAYLPIVGASAEDLERKQKDRKGGFVGVVGGYLLLFVGVVILGSPLWYPLYLIVTHWPDSVVVIMFIIVLLGIAAGDW